MAESSMGAEMGAYCCGDAPQTGNKLMFLYPLKHLQEVMTSAAVRLQTFLMGKTSKYQI